MISILGFYRWSSYGIRKLIYYFNFEIILNIKTIFSIKNINIKNIKNINIKKKQIKKDIAYFIKHSILLSKKKRYLFKY